MESSFGFHVIRLDSTRKAELQPLEQMKERITQQLSQTKPRELTNKYLALESERVKLLQAYMPKVSAAVGMKKAERYMHQISLSLRLESK